MFLCSFLFPKESHPPKMPTCPPCPECPSEMDLAKKNVGILLLKAVLCLGYSNRDDLLVLGMLLFISFPLWGVPLAALFNGLLWIQARFSMLLGGGVVVAIRYVCLLACVHVLCPPISTLYFFGIPALIVVAAELLLCFRSSGRVSSA